MAVAYDRRGALAKGDDGVVAKDAILLDKQAALAVDYARGHTATWRAPLRARAPVVHLLAAVEVPAD